MMMVIMWVMMIVMMMLMRMMMRMAVRMDVIVRVGHGQDAARAAVWAAWATVEW